MSGVVPTSPWDLAVQCVDEALATGVVPSLERLGQLGQIAPLPSLVAGLLAGDADGEAYTREREGIGLAPSEIAAELLTLGRLLEGHGEVDAREALDRCLLAYFGRVTGELAERARQDPLTGVLNHGAFHLRLAAEVTRARRYDGRLAVVLFDLDRFKETNDRDGHQEGDRILRAFAARLEGTVRESDLVGRVGGDEFAALLLEAGIGTVQALLNRLSDRLPEGVAAGAGAAFLPADGSSPERLLTVADRRLYADKHARAA